MGSGARLAHFCKQPRKLVTPRATGNVSFPCRRHGLARGGKEAAEAQRNLEHSLGLGQKPNSVPAGAANMNGEPRTIELGWHPVAGATGKWFAEKTKIGQAITKKIGKYPDPTQHWAVIVGDHVHELWMVCTRMPLVEFRTNKLPRTRSSTSST